MGEHLIETILVTGGAGFIGSNVTNALLSLGYRVKVLDSLEKQVHGENPLDSYLYMNLDPRVQFIHGDVRDFPTVREALKDCSAVVHLAAETGTGQSMYEISRYSEVNVKGTAVLLEVIGEFYKEAIKKIIVASSRAVYGEGKYRDSEGNIVYPVMRNISDLTCGSFDFKDVYNRPLIALPTDENSRFNPTSIYGITKLTQELMINSMCSTYGITSIALRYQNVYGPGQSLSNPYTGILSIFSSLILQETNINIFEDGLESRDFVNIRDVVNATVGSIQVNFTGNTAINIGSGIPTSVLNIAKGLIKCYGTKVELNVSGDFRMGDVRHNYADLNKAKEILSYHPETTLEQGLEEFSLWVKSQKIPDNQYLHSLEEMKAKGLFIKKA